MPSVTHMNRPSSLWDFVASLEQQGQDHPFFSQNRNNANERGEESSSAHPCGPWGRCRPGFSFRGFPDHPPQHEAQSQNDAEKEPDNQSNNDKDQDQDQDGGKGPSGGSSSGHEGCARGRQGRCGGGRCGSRNHARSHGHRGRGGCGPIPHYHDRRGGGWGHDGPFGFDFVASFFDAANNEKDTKNETGDFTPEADIFDTDSAFVVYLSLPGAKKEDVGVHWDPEKSELSIAGVIYRPGDEEFLKKLATNERKVGPFERKIRLGSQATPAQIDADMITAKLEDGVLRVQVPKMDSGFVEIRKIDVE